MRTFHSFSFFHSVNSPDINLIKLKTSSVSVATVMTDVFIYLENCRNVGRKIGKITKIFEELENPHDQGVI
jgi:hypothetical protein